MVNFLAGERARCKNRQTKTTIVLLDGIEGEMDISNGRWQTLCNEHSNICSHQTLKQAKLFMSSPLDWCATCQVNFEQSKSN